MADAYSLKIKLVPDGLGYYYGNLLLGKAVCAEVNLRLEATEDTGAAAWVGYINGEEVSRQPTRSAIDAAVLQYAAEKQLPPYAD